MFLLPFAKFLFQLILFFISALLQLTGAAAILVIFVGYLFWSSLPGKKEIESYRLETTVKPGKINWGAKDRPPVRIVVPLKEISPALVSAVVTSEDDLFYQHHGFNFEMLRMAVEKDLETGEYRYGASTITMQVAKNLFLTRDKTIVRKFKEALIAWRMEKILTKEQILENYLNMAEWGGGVFGAEAAARYYFGKPALGLTLAEATLMAGLLPNPNYYNPFVRLKSCQRKQLRILRLQKLARKISGAEEQAVLSSAIVFRGQKPGPTLLETFPPDSSEAGIPQGLK